MIAIVVWMRLRFCAGMRVAGRDVAAGAGPGWVMLTPVRCARRCRMRSLNAPSGIFTEQWAGAFGQACFAVQGMQGDVAGECVEEEL